MVMDASYLFGFGFLAVWAAAMVAINRLGLLSLAYRDRYTLGAVVAHLSDER